MSIEKQKFLARLRADLDWQQVGSNENPYPTQTKPEARQAYDDRFEEISFDWNSFAGGMA